MGCYGRHLTIRLRVNGAAHTVTVDPATPLLFVLTDDLALRGPRFGCGMAQCGSCTVMLDGQPVRSCVILVGHADGADILTLEGLGTPEAPHPLQQAFIDEGASQCGFCLSGSPRRPCSTPRMVHADGGLRWAVLRSGSSNRHPPTSSP